ncbi:MAG: hypothetical protein LQ338_002971 [Usnochroma carphineum]|nr:MAG: hypothetical protein LQ338_002971 [Usnochroma carphineum]
MRRETGLLVNRWTACWLPYTARSIVKTMLKSTYKPAAGPPPLPSGWTEHKAPTGHAYYYNAATQQSTYTRPVADPPPQTAAPDAATLHNRFSSFSPHLDQGFRGHYPPNESQNLPSTGPHRHAHNDFRGSGGRQRPQPKDRPKSRHAIPGCEPWVLVKTTLGRRFVYNQEQNRSVWKFPPEVMKAVVEYDRIEREKSMQDERKSISGNTKVESPKASEGHTLATMGPLPRDSQNQQDQPGEQSDEYEEVEVTDQEEDAAETASKRQKIEGNGSEQPVEFNEDDIAYQLAAMGQDYDLDPGEYGDLEGQDLEEGAEGLPLSEEDASALFKDMLDDRHINPYKPWEKLIEEGHIFEDDRYTLLPNMKSRKEVWNEWSRHRIQKLKEQREKEEKKDPQIPYLAFLQIKATPKLYWPEFRRKYMKEPEMRNAKLSDKEREKWYRDYINRLKLPESTLKSDLVAMLKSMSLHALNRSTPMAALPPAMLTDIRYISLRPSIRDPLIETHISTLAEAPATADVSAEEQEAIAKQRQERERREALAERTMQVQRDQRRVKEALAYSKGQMREGEEEVRRAMRVGKEGLLRYMEDGQPPLPPEGEL